MPGWLVRPRRALLAAWLVSLLAPGVAPAADSPATRAVSRSSRSPSGASSTSRASRSPSPRRAIAARVRRSA